MAKTILILSALVLVAGCHSSASDVGNGAAAAAHDLGNRADTLADQGDAWGNNASDRVDNASVTDKSRIGRLNDRLGKLVEPGTPTDKWVGRWKGVEGMNLVIAKDAKKGEGFYTMADQYTLDAKGVFAGHAVGDTIQFTRPDGDQVLRATDGMAIGLKYLATRKDCLMVKPGEGYCRG